MDAVKVAVGISLGVTVAWLLAFCAERVSKVYLTYLANKARLMEEERAEIDLKDAEVRHQRAAQLDEGPFSDPEDPDLLVYLRESHIANMGIDFSTHTVSIDFGGGWGYVFNPGAGETIMFPKVPEGYEPGEDFPILGGFSIRSTMPLMPIDSFEFFAKLLVAWQQNETSLKICIAPGAMATLMEEADDAHWVPLPMG